MDLSNHTVFITGGTSGIGLALATSFADLGNKVIICGRDPNKLNIALKNDPRLLGFIVDITKPGAIQIIMDALLQNHWRPSILINNAGVGMSVDLQKDDYIHLEHQISSQIQTNLQAPMLLAVAFIPLLKMHRESIIINITSGFAIVPTKSTPIYCATKAALRAFTRVLRYQLEDAKENIRVIEVLPPLVDTYMTRRSIRSKIPPQQVAKEVIIGLTHGYKEIYVGKTQLLKVIHAICPSLAAKLMRG